MTCMIKILSHLLFVLIIVFYSLKVFLLGFLSPTSTLYRLRKSRSYERWVHIRYVHTSDIKVYLIFFLLNILLYFLAIFYTNENLYREGIKKEKQFLIFYLLIRFLAKTVRVNKPAMKKFLKKSVVRCRR